MLRSASGARATEIARDQIQKHQQTRTAAVLKGRHAEQRAALILCVIAGFQLMRQTVGLPALADAKPNVLEKLLAPPLRQLMDREKPSAKKSRTRGRPAR